MRRSYSVSFLFSVRTVSIHVFGSNQVDSHRHFLLKITLTFQVLISQNGGGVGHGFGKLHTGSLDLAFLDGLNHIVSTVKSINLYIGSFTGSQYSLVSAHGHGVVAAEDGIDCWMG